MSTVANVAGLLRDAARQAPDRPALVEPASGRRMTWAELDAEVDRLAHGLVGLGLVAGQRVMLALPNRTELVVGYLATLRARLVAVPVNPRSTTGETARMMADAGPRLVLADPSTLATVRAAVAGIEDALVGADEELRERTVVPRVVPVSAPPLPGETPYVDLRSEPGAAPAPVGEDAEAVAALLYTSGTSGRPRAAMLTHRALLANVAQVAAVEPPLIGSDDVVLGVLPLSHVYGLNAVLGQVLRRHATLVLAEGFEPESTLALVEAEGVTVLPVAPPVLAHWRGVADLRQRLRGVHLVVSGSAPLSPELAADFEARSGVSVHEGYGLTEAAPVVTSTRRSRSRKPGSVGAPLADVQVRLREAPGDEPEGADPGEILLRGDNLFSGYWPDGADGPDGDGWWATGDIGLLDEDGDLFLVDRVKDVVVVSGFNVYPVEVEDVIGEVDAVAEAAVVGVPDERTGEAVVAYVTPARNTSLSADELVERVREHCAARLARFKQPTTVTVVDELPHTVIGKVAKGRLREARRRRHGGLLE